MFLKLEHRVQSLTITYKNRAKPSFLVKKPPKCSTRIQTEITALSKKLDELGDVAFMGRLQQM